MTNERNDELSLEGPFKQFISVNDWDTFCGHGVAINGSVDHLWYLIDNPQDHEDWPCVSMVIHGMWEGGGGGVYAVHRLCIHEQEDIRCRALEMVSPYVGSVVEVLASV